MITSIELSNWKTHKSTKLDFSKGTNILIGQMGSGNSSVMDAISYALFGNFPSIQHRRTNVSYLIRSKPKQEDTAKVKLLFEIEGHNYEVERAIGQKTTSTATLKRDGVYLQSQPQRVTEEIVKLLKMDYDLFSRAVYSQQNGLEYFLNLRSSERKKEIDNLLGLDRFSEAKENVTTLANRIKDLIKEDGKAVAELDAEKISEQIDIVTKEITECEHAEEASEKKFTETKKMLSLKDNELKAANDHLSRKNRLTQEIKELKGETDTLKSEIQKINENGTREAAQINAELSSLKVEEETTSKKLKDAKSKYEESGKIAATCDAKLNDSRNKLEKKKALEKDFIEFDKVKTEEELQKLRAAKEKSDTDLAGYLAEAKESEKNLKELESHFGKCPVCEKVLEDSLRNKLILERSKKIDELNGLASEAKRLIEKYRKDYDKFDNQLKKIHVIEGELKEYTDLENVIKELEVKLSASKQTYAASKTEYERTDSYAKELNQRLMKLQSEMDYAQRRERYSERLKVQNSSIMSKEKAAKEIIIDEESISKLHKEEMALSSEASRIESEIKASKKYRLDKMQQKKEKEGQLATVNRIKEGISKKKRVHENLEKFNTALTEAQAQLRNRLVESINGVMGDIWPELYPYGDYTDIMLDATEDDYVLKVQTVIREKLSWEDVDTIASGGERSTACLAMRIAFSLVLAPNIKWLILDEPTHNLDRQAVQKVVGIFGETLPRIIDQVFIITHEDQLKEVNGSNVYVLSRDKAQDKETEIISG